MLHSTRPSEWISTGFIILSYVPPLGDKINNIYFFCTTKNPEEKALTYFSKVKLVITTSLSNKLNFLKNI